MTTRQERLWSFDDESAHGRVFYSDRFYTATISTNWLFEIEETFCLNRWIIFSGVYSGKTDFNKRLVNILPTRWKDVKPEPYQHPNRYGDVPISPHNGPRSQLDVKQLPYSKAHNKNPHSFLIFQTVSANCATITNQIIGTVGFNAMICVNKRGGCRLEVGNDLFQVIIYFIYTDS